MTVRLKSMSKLKNR